MTHRKGNWDINFQLNDISVGFWGSFFVVGISPWLHDLFLVLVLQPKNHDPRHYQLISQMVRETYKRKKER